MEYLETLINTLFDILIDLASKLKRPRIKQLLRALVVSFVLCCFSVALRITESNLLALPTVITAFILLLVLTIISRTTLVGYDEQLQKFIERSQHGNKRHFGSSISVGECPAEIETEHEGSNLENESESDTIEHSECEREDNQVHEG